MPQFLPSHFKVSRCFREHCPPGYRLPGIQAPFGWMSNGDRFNMRPRPLKSQYTNELLVHPHFVPYNISPVRPQNQLNAEQLINIGENDEENDDRRRPRLLMPAEGGETGSFFGTVARRGDYNMANGTHF